MVLYPQVTHTLCFICLVLRSQLSFSSVVLNILSFRPDRFQHVMGILSKENIFLHTYIAQKHDRRQTYRENIEWEPLATAMVKKKQCHLANAMQEDKAYALSPVHLCEILPIHLIELRHTQGFYLDGRSAYMHACTIECICILVL